MGLEFQTKLGFVASPFTHWALSLNQFEVHSCGSSFLITFKERYRHLGKFFSIESFLLDIFFIYISNIFPFLGLSFRNSLSHVPLPLWGCSPTHPPTHSLLPFLAFPYTGASNTLRPKGLFSHWCPTRPSSATHALLMTQICSACFHVLLLSFLKDLRQEKIRLHS